LWMRWWTLGIWLHRVSQLVSLHTNIITTIEQLHLHTHLSYYYTEFLATCSAVRYRHLVHAAYKNLQGWRKSFYRCLYGKCLPMIQRLRKRNSGAETFYLLPCMKPVLSWKFFPQAHRCRSTYLTRTTIRIEPTFFPENWSCNNGLRTALFYWSCSGLIAVKKLADTFQCPTI
jgi:hypothetical protein